MIILDILIITITRVIQKYRITNYSDLSNVTVVTNTTIYIQYTEVVDSMQRV